MFTKNRLQSLLNGPQFDAATTVNGPVLILAGAGSGKTRTLIHRMAFMLSEGIKAKNILGITFTNKAAAEMRERVKALLGAKVAKDITLCTFHALGIKILKKEITKLGYFPQFSIYDSADQIAIVRDGLRSYKAEKAFDQKTIQSKISWLKNQGMGPRDFINSDLFDEHDPYCLATAHVYEFYQDKLRFFNAIDFDDILCLTVQLFTQFPEVAELYSRQYQYIMIDEYQDTNPLQLKLAKALTCTHNNLCVVGDDDQSIYAFRGADISNILQFENLFPNTKVIKLEENYRSTSPIIKLANHVIKENSQRKEKTLFSSRPSESKPYLWATADPEHEAAVVVDDINKLQESGKRLSDVAILIRSNTQVDPIEDGLRMGQIPYRILGGQKLYDKKEVKDLIAYLNFLRNQKDSISLRRIINVPARGIGTTTLSKYATLALENKNSIFAEILKNKAIDPNREQKITSFTNLIFKSKENFKNLSLGQAVRNLVEDLSYLDYIEKSYSGSPNQIARRKGDIERFIDSADRFQTLFGEKASLHSFLEKVLLQDNQDQDDLNEEGVKNEVTVMTLHSSKGLEFDRVYLLGVEEDILPHKRSIAEGTQPEERRLFYVGITRAKSHLFMSYCKERKLYGKQVKCNPSRFIHSIGDDFVIKQDRTTFGHLSEQEAKDYKKSFFQGLMDDL